MGSQLEKMPQACQSVAPHELSNCPEYLKMVNGLPFRALTSECLLTMKIIARRFCARYNSDDLVLSDNSMPPAELFRALRSERARLLRTILGNVSGSIVIEPPLNFQYGCNISIGDQFYANVNLRILDSARVTIGDRVLIGPNVTIITERHDPDNIQSRRDGIVYAKPVTIGDDCWICVGATILPGVTIGNGCTIGAGSVVTRDIPPFSVAWGDPARVVYKVHDPDARQHLVME